MASQDQFESRTQLNLIRFLLSWQHHTTAEHQIHPDFLGRWLAQTGRAGRRNLVMQPLDQPHVLLNWALLAPGHWGQVSQLEVSWTEKCDKLLLHLLVLDLVRFSLMCFSSRQAGAQRHGMAQRRPKKNAITYFTKLFPLLNMIYSFENSFFLFQMICQDYFIQPPLPIILEHYLEKG